MTTTTKPLAPIGSPEDRALDAATKGEGVRRGFHQVYTAVRFTDPVSGRRGLRHVAERCTCNERYSHTRVAA